MAEREYEYGKLIPVPEDQQEYIFDPEMRELLATGDAIQAYPASMETDRVGLPTALARGAADLFDTSRREVVMPAETKLGAATEFFNPITNEFESRADETIRPGVFMRPEEPATGAEARANMPLARGFSQAVDFAGDLITSPKARAQAIETLQGVPQMLTDQAKLSGIASLRGERVIDPDTGMTGTPYDAFLSATTPLAVGRAVSDVPRASFGIFGSGSGKSGKQAEDTVAMLEESGLDPSEGWERQDGANTYKAYRSSLDGKVRYEIPTTNVAFRGVFRETEDPDVELGKLLDPETRDQQRLEAMQGLRIRKNRYNDKEYIHVPGFSDLDETQLNKYGFTKLDSKVGKDGLQKFPAPVLEQIVDFPELFDEYPQLRSIQIKPTPSLALFLKGAYNPDTKEISLASVPNTAEGRKEMMSTLLHEMQHAVQDIEGLYGGANTRMFEPTGFAERQTKNQNARKEVDKEIGDSLDNLVVTLDDSASKKPKTGLFGKIFGLSSPTLPPRTQTGLAGADEERVRFVKRATIGYLRARAEEEEQLAAGELTVGERSRRELEDAITRRQQQLRDLGASEDEIADVEAEYRGQAFRYGGSDREMIYLADELKKAGVKNSEKVAERIGNAFDEQIQKLRPILKEKEQIEEISSRSYEMYAGNPGEVEARNVQRRFEGIEEGEYLRHPSGELRPFTDKVTPAGMQTLDPEVTQGMVLPEGGLVYSLAEGRKGQPSFSIDDPSDPQMDLPGMGPTRPVPTEDPAASLLSMRDGMMGALRQDKLGARKRQEIQASLNRVNQRIFGLRQEAGYPTDNLYANGGMVNNMKPRVTQGLTNLLNKYNASGPLAGAGNVPRGTMPVQMNQGGDPELEGFPAAPVVDPVQFPQPVFSTAPALPPEAALPPSVYTPPAQTPVTVPTQPMFTTPSEPEPYAVPAAPAPGMLSDAVVDFDISDQITPQTEGYATTRDLPIQATGDPFADAVEGEYQMPIYKPQVMPGSMPFMSVRYGRPGTPSEQPPEPPRSDQYSTGSFGRANYAEALSNWERMYGPVEDYQAPDTEAVMGDNGEADTGTTPGTTTPGGTAFYPVPPPVRGSGGPGPQNLYNRQLEAWEAQYGPVEDYYAAQRAAENNPINVYLSSQGEEAVAAQYGYTVEQLRLINEDRRKLGLAPLGDLIGDININPGSIGAF